MSNWRERLQEEAKQLNTKRLALLEFIDSEKYKELNPAEQSWLQIQKGIMLAYYNVLVSRATIAFVDKEEEEDERMKNIVRNGNDGAHYWYDDTERNARILAEGKRDMEEIMLGIKPKDETEYLTSSKANKEHLEQAMKEFDKSCDEHIDRIAETKITPKSLLELGFKEVYQGVDYGETGYIFYSLDIKGVGFCSVDTESKDFHVRLDYDDYPIHNLRKLKDLILSLNELS